MDWKEWGRYIAIAVVVIFLVFTAIGLIKNIDDHYSKPQLRPIGSSAEELIAEVADLQRDILELKERNVVLEVQVKRTEKMLLYFIANTLKADQAEKPPPKTKGVK